MVSAADRDGYSDTLRRALRPAGHATSATFGPDGPGRCSGLLRTRRYDAPEQTTPLGASIRLIATRSYSSYTTPAVSGSDSSTCSRAARRGLNEYI